MSGYGGNLTYPTTKVFRNNFGPDAWYKIYEDLKAQNGVAGNHTMAFSETGDSIVGTPNANVTVSYWKPETAKTMNVFLEDRAPLDEGNHELGFTVVKESQHPGVMNDNYYGQRRTYAHKFEVLDPVTAGLISDEDLLRAYSDISGQIGADKGRYTGYMQGSYEAVVDAVQHTSFKTPPGTAVFDIPALGVYSAALADTVPGTTDTVGDYIKIDVAPMAGAYTNAPLLSDGSAGVTKPYFGYIVHDSDVPAVMVIDKTKTYISLSTKKEYTKDTTFLIEKLSGRSTTTLAGNFESLPWAEVYREFAHMEHMVPLSNHHADEKPADIVIDAVTPANTLSWAKFILDSYMPVGSFHGASHGETYNQTLMIYLRANAADHASFLAQLNAWKV